MSIFHISFEIAISAHFSLFLCVYYFLCSRKTSALCFPTALSTLHSCHQELMTCKCNVVAKRDASFKKYLYFIVPFSKLNESSFFGRWCFSERRKFNTVTRSGMWLFFIFQHQCALLLPCHAKGVCVGFCVSF